MILWKRRSPNWLILKSGRERRKMKSIVLTVLSIFLGLFFLFVGVLKITPMVNREMHREIRKNFVKYAKAFPLASLVNVKVSPKVYRIAVGWIEIVAGFTLALIPGCLKQIANSVLLLLTLLALYTHSMVETKFERIAPSIVFTLMLICRLIVYYQIRRRTVKETQRKSSKESKKRDWRMEKVSPDFQSITIEFFLSEQTKSSLIRPIWGFLPSRDTQLNNYTSSIELYTTMYSDVSSQLNGISCKSIVPIQLYNLFMIELIFLFYLLHIFLRCDRIKFQSKFSTFIR